ncbi:hypothetical protein KC902_02330 [Candidatus Kaiserbacteria bacterium]|nr:hypothetical protein [Candidatus Kaiserbacteria bacterium]USN89035.1 MAG: hypothetical protein H6780_01265 [Candidatus Nomurabacteria bacterium]
MFIFAVATACGRLYQVAQAAFRRTGQCLARFINDEAVNDNITTVEIQTIDVPQIRRVREWAAQHPFDQRME